MLVCSIHRSENSPAFRLSPSKTRSRARNLRCRQKTPLPYARALGASAHDAAIGPGPLGIAEAGTAARGAPQISVW